MLHHKTKTHLRLDGVGERERPLVYEGDRERERSRWYDLDRDLERPFRYEELLPLNRLKYGLIV